MIKENRFKEELEIQKKQQQREKEENEQYERNRFKEDEYAIKNSYKNQKLEEKRPKKSGLGNRLESLIQSIHFFKKKKITM